MQPQENLSGNGEGSAQQPGAMVCTRCGAPMPKEMRFCRSCGNRLGEGSAEYTETVRFPHGTAAQNALGTTPFVHDAGGPIVVGGACGLKRKRRLSGMTWVLIVIAIFFCLGGAISALKGVRAPVRISAAAADRSYVGVNKFTTTDGGVTFKVIEPPGSPADKAGLVGGDIVTSFDGHPVKTDDEMQKLLQQTPIGKTVEVLYLRDGQPRKAQLTTISEEARGQLNDTFGDRPEGKGVFGFLPNRTTVISIPETKTYGLRLDWIEQNSPADLFGIKKGDIVTDFDGVPIRTPDEMLSRVRRAIPYDTVDVNVIRDGQPMKISVKVGKR